MAKVDPYDRMIEPLKESEPQTIQLLKSYARLEEGGLFGTN